MSTIHTDPETVAPKAARPRHLGRILLVVAGGLLVVLLVLTALFVIGFARPIPQFPSLADKPDPTLTGTVAYLQDSTGCVRVVAAAGQPSRQVLCLPDQDVKVAEEKGKLVGPQLVWRDDNRLEITMFRLTDPPGPTFRPGWQKVVDVTTGAVEDTPDADVPSTVASGTEPSVAPDGRRITWASDAGAIEVVLHEGTTARTLLSAQGPDDHTYGLDNAFWSPTWNWVAADDGRILVITTGATPVTRVLTDESTMGGYGGYARFAVTAADLLGTG